MLGPLAFLCALLFPGGADAVILEQSAVVTGHLGSLADLPCKATALVSYIHWYRHQEGTAPKRILRLEMSMMDVRRDGVLKADKVNARKGQNSKSCTLSLLNLEKSDEGVYYCAAWEAHSLSRRPGL